MWTEQKDVEEEDNTLSTSFSGVGAMLLLVAANKQDSARLTMNTVASVLMNIHMNIFALASGSCVLWSLVVIVGIWPSTPPFSTSPFLPFSSNSASDMLMSVRSEALESGRSIEGERYWVPVKRFSREGDDGSSKSKSAFIDAIAQPRSWLGEWK